MLHYSSKMSKRTIRPGVATRAAPEPDFMSGWRDVQAMHAAVDTGRGQHQRGVVLEAFTGHDTGYDTGRALGGIADELGGVASGAAPLPMVSPILPRKASKPLRIYSGAEHHRRPPVSRDTPRRRRARWNPSRRRC